MGIILPNELHMALRERHRKERDGRVKDRIKAVLLRDKGYSYEEIAEVLFLSDEAARKQVSDYLREEKLAPENGGSEPELSAEDTAKLVAHLHERTYLYVREIVAYVEKEFCVTYSVSGMTALLHRNGFSYHRPAVVPAKADKAKQEVWLAWYENLKKTLGDDDHILFGDGVHPTHEVQVACGWIKKGVRKEIPTNGSGRRLNILGGLDLAEMKVYTQEYETIRGEQMIAFLTYLLVQLPRGMIHLIFDQARYSVCAEVAAWLALNPRIRLHFLPSYSPNLNAIECLWKLMREHVMYNRYYAHFKDFTEAIRGFFNVTFPKNALDWTDRLTDNFRVMQSPLIANS
jgi:transposase